MRHLASYGVMFAVALVSYAVGWLRGAYVMMRCKDGNCDLPSCGNYAPKK
jgi:hypothetical protein